MPSIKKSQLKATYLKQNAQIGIGTRQMQTPCPVHLSENHLWLKHNTFIGRQKDEKTHAVGKLLFCGALKVAKVSVFQK